MLLFNAKYKKNVYTHPPSQSLLLWGIKTCTRSSSVTHSWSRNIYSPLIDQLWVTNYGIRYLYKYSSGMKTITSKIGFFLPSSSLKINFFTPMTTTVVPHVYKTICHGSRFWHTEFILSLQNSTPAEAGFWKYITVNILTRYTCISTHLCLSRLELISRL